MLMDINTSKLKVPETFRVSMSAIVGSVAGKVKASFVTMTLIEGSGFNPHPGHVFVFLDKPLYDDYLYLMDLNKKQIQWTRIRRNPLEHWIIENF